MATKYEMSAAAAKRVLTALATTDLTSRYILDAVREALRDNGFRGVNGDIRRLLREWRSMDKHQDTALMLTHNIADALLSELDTRDDAIGSVMRGLSLMNHLTEQFAEHERFHEDV